MPIPTYPAPRRRGDDGDSGGSGDFDGSDDFEIAYADPGGRRGGDPDSDDPDELDDPDDLVDLDNLIELDDLADLDEQIEALLANPPTAPATGSLAGLGDGAASDEQLLAFSDLSLAALRDFAEGWVGLPAEARRGLVTAMDELSADRIEADFRRVYRLAMHDEDAGVRQLAVAALAGEDAPGLVRPLLALLADDASVDVRAEAARTLGPIAYGAATEEYEDDLAAEVRAGLMAAAHDDDPLVRRVALESAAVFGGEEIADLIRDAYDTGEHDAIGSALYAMGRTHDRGWLPIVLEELASDDAQLRFEAARAAGALGERESVGDLLAAMNGEEDVEVRHAIIAALGEIGGKAAQRALTTLQAHAEEADVEAIEDAIEEAAFDLQVFGR
ncbi:MAG: HEAT repeat domain-containing protein [Chloroflexota bacterium]